MTTVLAGPSSCHYSRPRPGFSSPEVARRAALIFVGLGQTGAFIRQGKDPGDRLFAELADGVDRVLAEGLTPDDCREQLGIRSEPWATPSYCSGCYRSHPGACGCPCHLPAARSAA